MGKPSPPSATVFAASFAVLVLAVLVRLAIDPIAGSGYPFVTLFAAVAAAVWIGGRWPAAAVALTGYIAAAHLFVDPRDGVHLEIPANLAGFVLYLATCGAIVLFGEASRRAQIVSREAFDLARQQKDILLLTLSSIGDAVITSNKDGIVTYVNPVAADLTGWSAGLSVGEPLSSVFRVLDERSRSPLPSPAERVVREGGPLPPTNHTVLVSRDGRERVIDMSAAPIKDRKERAIGAVLVFHDVTDRRNSEKQLRRAEQELRDFFDNAAIGMHWASPDGTMVRVNQTELEMLGYTAGEYVGRNLADFHADKARAAAFMERLERGEEVVNFEARLRGKDGSIRTVLIHSNVYREDGKFVHSRCLTQDITALKEAQEALRKNEERLRLAQSIARIGTFEIDLSTGMVHATAELAAMYGQDRVDRDATAEDWHALVHPEDREEVERKTAESLVTGTYEHQWRILWPDGSEHWIAGRASAFPDEMGKPRRMLGVNIDVTEQKHAEHALKEADRNKDQFLATLAHELRNPLAPVRNALDILRHAGNDPTMLANARAVMERQVAHLVRLIDDLLDVSRITRNRLDLRKETIELAAVLDQAIETSQPLFEQAGQDFAVHLPPGRIQLDADAVRLAQVFGNLLTNASKYTERGGRIELDVRREGIGDKAEVVAVVRDTGMGIPPDKLPQVFDMFTQIDRSLSRSQGGLGIGLALVKTLVELHGGSVSAASRGLGRGSEFTVRLPVTTVREEKTRAEEEKMEEATPIKSARRVLVVDDNEDAAMTLAMLLQLKGSDTRMAHDGLDAIAKAEEFRPDVILLDIGLPKMDGYDACRAIREQPWGSGIKMIALTGWGQEDDRRKSMEAGFDMHLVKPVAPSALMKMLADG